jgi:hypothetical protein
MIPAVIGSTLARHALTVQKNAPQLLFSAGVVGTVGSTILACRATLKVDQVLEEAKERRLLIDSVHEESSAALDPTLPSYTQKDREKDITKLQVQTTIRIVKLYAPAIILGGASIAALTQSHRLLTSRNAALTAAYTVLEKGFSQYRARVVDRYGENVDRELRYGTELVEVKDEKTGRKKKVTRVGPEGESIYARFFDPFSSSWSRDPVDNIIFLKCQQDYANDLLARRGHVFLNEVYNSLGLSHTKEGAIVGWVLSRDGTTDNFISFGIFEDNQNQQVIDFFNGHEGSVLLDFNVDGIILDNIDKGEQSQWQLNP